MKELSELISAFNSQFKIISCRIFKLKSYLRFADHRSTIIFIDHLEITIEVCASRFFPECILIDKKLFVATCADNSQDQYLVTNSPMTIRIFLTTNFVNARR